MTTTSLSKMAAQGNPPSRIRRTPSSLPLFVIVAAEFKPLPAVLPAPFTYHRPHAHYQATMSCIFFASADPAAGSCCNANHPPVERA